MSMRSLLALVAASMAASLGKMPELNRHFRPGQRRLTGVIGPAQVGGKKPSRRDRHRALVAASKVGQSAPKFAKERKHSLHDHPQRDEAGAYTLIGKAYTIEHCDGVGNWLGTEEVPRRKWLAGISAQRGY